MARFKLKLKEAAPNLAQQGNYKVGDVSYSKDGDTRYTVDAVNPESGKVSWKVTNLPNFDKLFDDVSDAAISAKGVYTKVKDDEKFREFYEELKQTRNKIRTHLRKEYPEDYKRMTMNEEDVEEMSTSGGAGGYLTPYAFKPTKKKKKAKMGMPSGMVSSLGEEKDPGATLGPGPAASEDGVKDNAYVKQFKYQLVPKNKNGTYVQKGSGLEVKKLF
jgi:hypothetical protein|tara:strand:+ start:741 stop:1391 length:651 start_codon:yes stop_codon:yes gene_type:complete